jgi:peptidoglycan/LPS O-acetylase OafA/YrhL
MSNNSQSRLDQLTGLRYFAALLVFVSHLKWENSADFIKTIFGSGYVGVSFFFVLSGFVLSYSYQDKIASGEITFTKYMYLRFARLTPLHFATLIPFIGLAIYTEKFDPIILLANLSYLQSWIPHSSAYFSFNAPSWSLSNEMFFYLCFFFLAVIPFRKLLNIAIALIAFVILCAVVVTIFFDGEKLFGSNNTIAHWMFYIFPGFRILEFLCGMILFHFWKSGYVKNSNYIFPAYLILILAMYFADFVPEAFRLSLFFLPVIVLFLFAHLKGDGLINRFFKTKTMILLGNASFAFYLIHQPLIHIFKRLLDKFNLDDLSFFLISLTAITLLSIATYLLYEKWAENKLKRFSYRI